MAVAPRTLPPPVIDPADLQAILPSLTPEEAILYSSLATLVLEAVIWPSAIPSPLPPPVNAAGLSIAVRLAQSGEAGGEGGGSPVVSETIGGYTYRLATPDSLASGFALTDAERALLGPWLTEDEAFDFSTLGGPYAWPADWWQRDYDRLEEAPMSDAQAFLTVGEADATYSKLGHAHPRVGSGPWSFSTSVVAEDPGEGNVRLNATPAPAATEVFLNPVNMDGIDYGPLLGYAVEGDTLRLQDRDNAANYEEFALTGNALSVVVTTSPWLRFPVAHVESGGALALTNNQALLLYFSSPGHA